MWCQARKIEQEISFQIQESKKINSKKERELIDAMGSLETERNKLRQVQIRVNQALKDVRSYRNEKIDTYYLERGVIEGELMQLRSLLENAEVFQSLKVKQNSLTDEISTLTSEVESIRDNQNRLKANINKKIEEIGVYLLNNDLKRQNEFFQAKEFHVDYRNNLAFIADKNAKYSASSNFYLKTSARFAIFLASLSVERMRYPRFIVCDNMEDNGIEKERAQNFQRILMEYLEAFDNSSYQVIYTTSFIPDEYNNDNYCVGGYYAVDNPSLKNVN